MPLHFRFGALSLGSALLALTAGCFNVGPKQILPQKAASGALVAVRIPGEGVDRVGELYSVDSVAVIIRSSGPGGLQRIPWSLRFPMDVDGLGADFDVRSGELVLPLKRAKLALVSRFPQGLRGELLAKVIDQLKQPLVEVGSAGPQGPPPLTLDALATATAAATEKFSDRGVAIRAGYRRIGTDFPAMGEHWIQPAVLLSGVVDPARPTMLTYATLADRPVLLGVGYVVTTSGRLATPAVPGWPDEWHEHSGLLDEESGAKVAPSSRAATSGTAPSTHVWVLHIWTRLPNAAGPYQPDNWSLPFARAGLAAPSLLHPEPALALSLLHGGDVYLRSALDDAGMRDPSGVVDSLVADARRRATLAVRRTPLASAPDASDLSELANVWRSLARSVTAVLGPNAAPFFAPPHGSRTVHGGH